MVDHQYPIDPIPGLRADGTPCKISNLPQEIQSLLSLLELVAELRPRPRQEAFQVDGERRQIGGERPPPARTLLNVPTEDIFAVERDLRGKRTTFLVLFQ